MSNYPLFFELNGISVPVEANVEFNQDYEALSSETWPPLRFMNGSGVKQTAWSGKLRTVLTGAGWMPAGLDGLDYSATMVLKCAGPRGISSASNAITIPSARRSDTGFAPYGYAIVGGKRVDSPVGLAGNVATVTSVSGATGYGVYYYPQMTVSAQAPRTTGNLVTGDFSWSLEAEEI
ncbi:MAG: hypothetical protein DRQ61_09030 [Gammaproteobacteria bacterium]|nr:MAG: hypothetical protein DRQ61_09030 [Gammaproteobacteria bacterium]